MTTYYNDYDEEDSYEAMENQINEEKYFDECWDLHSALTDHLEENCIPIMQNCDFSSFYKLCQYGKRYIVNLEHQQKQKEQQQFKFFENINKPFPKIKNSSKGWVTLGKKKSIVDSSLNKDKKEEKEEKEEIINSKNPLSKFNWTKKQKKKKH